MSEERSRVFYRSGTMADWAQALVGDLCRVRHGYAFKGEYFRADGELIVLTPGNFEAGGGLKERPGKEKFYEGEFDPEYLLAAGSLVMVMTDLKQDAPILGSVARVPCDGRYLHNQRIGLVTELADNVVPDFLYYVMNSELVRRQLRATATGSTVRHTAPERVHSCEVSLPPFQIQELIAWILGSLDELIRNNRHRIEILEEMARLLYREWFVQYRFPGGDEADLLETENGPVPAGWGWKRLAEACDLTMGQSPKSEFYNDQGDGLPFHQGVTDFGFRYPTHSKWCTVENRVAEADDILVSVRAPVGRINVAPEKMVIGRGLSALRSLDGHQTFLFEQLRHVFAVEDSMGGGTIFKAVTKRDMQDIQLIEPPSDLVHQWSELATPMFDLVRVLTFQNRCLVEARDLLLPRLISGELDVSELDLELEPVS